MSTIVNKMLLIDGIQDMTTNKFKKYDKVYDSWYPDWGIGEVIDVKKTVVRVRFPGQVRGYDLSHIQFLRFEEV